MVSKKVEQAALSFRVAADALSDYTKDLIALHEELPAIFPCKPHEMSLVNKMQLGVALTKLDNAFKRTEE